MTIGSGIYCHACIPCINVCGRHTIDRSIYLFRCPNSGEGCEWTGEFDQLENHLNPQPTTADNLLNGCHFETLHFKRYEIKPQNFREFKVVVVCVVLSLLAILISGGLMMKHIESRAIMQHKLLAELNNTMQLVIGDFEKQMEELRTNYSLLESKHEQYVKELERKHDSLMSEVVSLESQISDLNSSQHLQERSVYDHSMKHVTENNDREKNFNDEWLVDVVTELIDNQQVNSLVLPRHRMPLLLRKQDTDYIVMVSAPFSTIDEGYRMRALAHPIAKDDSDSLGIVVCVCVLQGKYDQTLQWPLNARFTLTLYMNETNWKTEEITFPSDKYSDHSFINSTRNFFVIKDRSCVEYEIKREYDITATIFDLDIVRKFSWWEITLQIIDYIVKCLMYLFWVSVRVWVWVWYFVVTVSSLVVVSCFFLCFFLRRALDNVVITIRRLLDNVVTTIRRHLHQYVERMLN